MKHLLIGAVLSLSSFFSHGVVSCERWDNLDLEQKANLHVAYFLGSEHDLGWTLSAIALAESNAGKWRLNYQSNDFGLFQINMATASSILSITNRYKLFELAERLLYDDVLGADLAIDVLEHFRRGRILTNSVYKEMIMSYNRGYRWKHDKAERKNAEAYYHRVQTNVRMLKKCSDINNQS